MNRTQSLTDTHCHLMLDDFEDDREAVILHAETMGVQKILVPGIDMETSRQALSLASRYPSLYAAVGIHPHNASDWDEETRLGLMDLARADKVVAIGEIGLDYYRDLSPRPKQMEAFKAQMEIAYELDMPIIVHQRESLVDVLKLSTEWTATLGSTRASAPGVLHAFAGKIDQGLEAIQAGFYLGVGGPITFKNAHDARETTRQLPLEGILLETDAPYLSPDPFRGKRNEPGHVRIIAEKLADLLNKKVNVVADATNRNAEFCFGW